jgi:hypothetical protein
MKGHNMMRMKISMYWPLAVMALIAVSGLHAYKVSVSAPHEPLAAERVVAELARTVSYGFVSERVTQQAPVAREALPTSAPMQAS